MNIIESQARAKASDVELFLQLNNISYEKEANLTQSPLTGHNLRYDYYLESNNLIIEFDGIQHFEPVSFFGGEDEFNIRKTLDQHKNEYCAKNEINLVRIPYDITIMKMCLMLKDALSQKDHFIWLIQPSSFQILTFDNTPLEIKIYPSLEDYFNILIQDGLLDNNKLPLQSLYKGYLKFYKLIYDQKSTINQDYFTACLPDLLPSFKLLPDIERVQLKLKHYDLVSNRSMLSQVLVKKEMQKTSENTYNLHIKQFKNEFKAFLNHKDIFQMYLKWCEYKQEKAVSNKEFFSIISK